MALELLGRLHLVYPVTQGLLDERQAFLVALALLGLGLVLQAQVAVHGGTELLAVVGAQAVRQELVRPVGAVEDLHAPLLQQLRLRQAVDGRHSVAGGVIDILLTFGHAVCILPEGHQLFLRGGVEQQQFLEVLPLLAELVQHAHLQGPAEVLIELLIARPVIREHLLQLRDNLLFQVGGDDLQLPVMLQQLTGDVQAQVRGVHHAPHEAEILRQQLLAVVHDHDAGGIQLQARLKFLGVIEARHLGGDEQQGLVGHRALSRHGDNALGWGHLTEALLVKFVVLLFLDLALFPLPQGHHAVEGLPLIHRLILGLIGRAVGLFHRMGQEHLDGEANIVGVFLHQGLDGPVLQILAELARLLAVLFHVHDDVRAHGVPLRLGDGVALRAGGLPLPGLGLAVLLGHHGDVVGHHEGRVKAHAELADDVGIPGGFLPLLLAELKAAAGGDDAQVVLQLLGAHADVADGEGAGVLVHRDSNSKVAPVQAHLIIREGQVAELVDSVRGVGQDLPQEDLLMGVNGVHHQVQQPPGLGLELLFAHK